VWDLATGRVPRPSFLARAPTQDAKRELLHGRQDRRGEPVRGLLRLDAQSGALSLEATGERRRRLDRLLPPDTTAAACWARKRHYAAVLGAEPKTAKGATAAGPPRVRRGAPDLEDRAEVYMAAYTAASWWNMTRTNPRDSPRTRGSSPILQRDAARAAADDGRTIYYACSTPYAPSDRCWRVRHQDGPRSLPEQPLPDQQIQSLRYDRSRRSLLCGRPCTQTPELPAKLGSVLLRGDRCRALSVRRQRRRRGNNARGRARPMARVGGCHLRRRVRGHRGRCAGLCSTAGERVPAIEAMAELPDGTGRLLWPAARALRPAAAPPG